MLTSGAQPYRYVLTTPTFIVPNMTTTLQYCEVAAASDDCSCPEGMNKMTAFQDGQPPSSFQFNISGLFSHTHYCVQSVGRYRVVDRLRVEGEVTPGQGQTVLTQGDRPGPVTVYPLQYTCSFVMMCLYVQLYLLCSGCVLPCSCQQALICIC